MLFWLAAMQKPCIKGTRRGGGEKEEGLVYTAGKLLLFCLWVLGAPTKDSKPGDQEPAGRGVCCEATMTTGMRKNQKDVSWSLLAAGWLQI
ncbi:hypothetical protein TRV_04348 [Trichophyton verrucosum HKI 0517]|uniref:Uncharacterized protein n=1 Tax=Trichophyton verrucosum (strain HKI 0517) TaxID=663202 RepID=D4DB49_TRIVH|nr:uncharacterized protein TRV_04348 [Trichophyton verrucosum HKI 0517]EFE40883.1 hypothetical protein TRV_04348 [Trichophyton verrucosum HKI 0517]